MLIFELHWNEWDLSVMRIGYKLTGTTKTEKFDKFFKTNNNKNLSLFAKNRLRWKTSFIQFSIRSIRGLSAIYDYEKKWVKNSKKKTKSKFF